MPWEHRGWSDPSMNKNSMPTHTLLLTSASHTSFAMMPSKSSITTMAAAPWWTERSPNSEILGWKLRSQDIDSTWRNVIIWHYTVKGLRGRTSPTMMQSSELEDFWLTPEVLHGSEQPCSPSSSQIDNQPASPPNHPNLFPYPLDPHSRLAFPGSPLAKALLTGPLPLPYRMKMDSSSSVYPRLTIQGSTTKPPFAATARSEAMTKRHAPIASATSVQKHIRRLAAPSLTAAVLTITAGFPSVTQITGSSAPPKLTST